MGTVPTPAPTPPHSHRPFPATSPADHPMAGTTTENGGALGPSQPNADHARPRHNRSLGHHGRIGCGVRLGARRLCRGQFSTGRGAKFSGTPWSRGDSGYRPVLGQFCLGRIGHLRTRTGLVWPIEARRAPIAVACAKAGTTSRKGPRQIQSIYHLQARRYRLCSGCTAANRL